MSALHEYDAKLEQSLPTWPPSANGVDLEPPSHRWVDTGRRDARDSDLAGFTPEGCESLRRILERVLRANGRRP